MEFVYIHWSCRNLEEARTISRSLLEKQWVACASLIPHVESHYLWKGKIEVDEEVKVIFKTRSSHCEAIRLYIEKHGSYEVPEIVQITMNEINPSYLKWLSVSILNIPIN